MSFSPHSVRRALATGAILMAMSCVTSPLDAQEAPPAPTESVTEAFPRAGGAVRFGPPGRARLGLYLRTECGIEADSGRDCETRRVVTSVVEDAPAARAGVQPGDTLLSLDGIPLETGRGRRAMADLRDGVPVRLTVGRGGGRREIEVIPTARPLAGVFEVQATRGAWWPAPAPDVRVFRFRADDGGTAEFYLAPKSAGAPPAPDGFVVFGEDETGELRLRTGRPDVELRTPDGRRMELAELEGREAEDVRFEVEIASPESPGDVQHRIVLQNAELARHLESVRRNVLQRARARLDSVRLSEVVPSFRYEHRHRAPVPSQEHRLAGAEFRPLTPELAEYFPVDAGLLVLRVIPGTPAHSLGLRGGDVVVEVGGHKMRDVIGFRRLLAEALAGNRPLEVKWNRKGERMDGRIAGR